LYREDPAENPGKLIGLASHMQPLEANERPQNDSSSAVRKTGLVSASVSWPELAAENHPAIQRGGSPFTIAARLKANCVSDALDDVAEPDLLVNDETWKTDSVCGLVVTGCVFLPFGKRFICSFIHSDTSYLIFECMRTRELPSED
jgi:hypothetical protein